MVRSIFRKCGYALLAVGLGALLIPPAVVSWFLLCTHVRDGAFIWPVFWSAPDIPADVQREEEAPLRISMTVPAHRPCTWHRAPDGRLVILLDARPVIMEIRSSDGNAA